MSSRECIWGKHPVDVGKYLKVLQAEFGAQANPHEPGSFLIGEPPLPFYAPQLIEGQLAITSFNRVPLSPTLILALAAHPELVPPTTSARWTEEQELIGAGTLRHWKERLQKGK